MIKAFLFILCLFLFIGCGRHEAAAQDSPETQGSTEEVEAKPLTEEIKNSPEQEKKEEPVQEATSERPNPFLTQEEEGVLKETGAVIPLDYLVLSAVLYSPNASRAIISGKILSVGDSIDNKRVIRIEAESVVLKDAQGEYIVRLKGVAGE